MTTRTKELFGRHVYERHLWSEVKGVLCNTDNCNNHPTRVFTIAEDKEGSRTDEHYFLCENCYYDFTLRDSRMKSMKDFKAEMRHEQELLLAQDLLEKAWKVEEDIFKHCARTRCINNAEINITSKVSGKDRWICKECMKGLQKSQIVHVNEDVTELYREMELMYD
jgi:hypothetical protein